MAPTATPFQGLAGCKEFLALVSLARTEKMVSMPTLCQDRPARLQRCQDLRAQLAHRSPAKTAETELTAIQCQDLRVRLQQFRDRPARRARRSQAMTEWTALTVIRYQDCRESRDCLEL